MSAEIFQFSTAPSRSAKIKTSTRVGEDIGDNLPAEITFGRINRPLPPPATETAKNSQIRTVRKDAWWLAERASSYWLARADWVDKLETAQEWKVADSASLGQPPGDRITLIRMWRKAIVKQLLTPAPDGRAVAWKRAKLAASAFDRLLITAERVEQAIAEDVAFLAAHPDPKAFWQAVQEAGAEGKGVGADSGGVTGSGWRAIEGGLDGSYPQSRRRWRLVSAPSVLSNGTVM